MNTGASRNDIPARERLIFAMDVADADAARRLAERLGDSVGFYKVGLELFMAGGYFELLEWMVGRGKKVFVDLKFFDVPATVAAAVARLRTAASRSPPCTATRRSWKPLPPPRAM
jgi:orotidine-5'-phosphate decarboxylase